MPLIAAWDMQDQAGRRRQLSLQPKGVGMEDLNPPDYDSPPL